MSLPRRILLPVLALLLTASALPSSVSHATIHEVARAPTSSKAVIVQVSVETCVCKEPSRSQPLQDLRVVVGLDRCRVHRVPGSSRVTSFSALTYFPLC
jgi:hypothetical protein